MGSSDEQEDIMADPIPCLPTFQSKLPVLDKSKLEETGVKHQSDALSKIVNLETLYSVLSEEHLGLHWTLKETLKRLKIEEVRRKEAEERLNPINVALARRIQILEESEVRLKRENTDLRDENDLLEFRLLELEDVAPIKRTPSRSSDPGRLSETRLEAVEMDDVSDSGVVSLPTSDDEHHEFNLEARNDRDIKSRLMTLCQSASTVSERICLQQALALLRHYEARIDGLESTIAAMCHEATMSRALACGKSDETASSNNIEGSRNTTGGRIIATVLPFSEGSSKSANLFGDELHAGEATVVTSRKDVLVESGIFEDSFASRSTQTDPVCARTSQQERGGSNLSAELQKLSRIRERIEGKSPPSKDLAYYEARVEALQNRLAVYETSGDEHTKVLRATIQRSTLLTAQVCHLKEKIDRLVRENQRLEEERSELEEIENDTRLRCQRLESKLSALSDKKRSLKLQLQELRKEMTNRDDERSAHIEKMESLVGSYERKNQELEEREMEVRYRLQLLENTMPALMMWNVWRVMASSSTGGPPAAFIPTDSSAALTAAAVDDETYTKEEELAFKLKTLEGKLNTQSRLLESSKATEDSLRMKLLELENLMSNTGGKNVLQMVDETSADVEVLEKLGRMARERMEMDRRIKDLELKEKVYKETLEQADNMINQLENQFKNQLTEKDTELSETTARLKDSETKLKTAEKTVEKTATSASNLQDRVSALETELVKLRKKLNKREKEKKSLEEDEQKLFVELQGALQEIDRTKTDVVQPLRSQIEVTKRQVKNLEDQLVQADVEKAAVEDQFKSEVGNLKNQIAVLQRELLENDVTIGELKEEVVTLEGAIDELKEANQFHRADKEDLVRKLESKLEEKEREIEAALASASSSEVKSLKEELEDVRPSFNGDCEKENMDGVNHSKRPPFAGGEMIEQEISWAKGEHRRSLVSDSDQQVLYATLVEPPKPQVRKMIHVLEKSCSTYSDDVLKDLSYSSANVHNQEILETMADTEEQANQDESRVNNDEPAISVEPTVESIEPTDESQRTDEGGGNVDGSRTGELEGEPPSSAPSNKREDDEERALSITPECMMAEDIVAKANSKNFKQTLDNISTAYNHSKTCNRCLDKVQPHLDGLVKEMGIKLPRIKQMDDTPQYRGQPTALKTSELGPGSVGWEPKHGGGGGYKMKPTLSSLALSVNELRDRSRIKDLMIKVLADDLLHFGPGAGWSPNGVLSDVTDFPLVDPPDFDRSILFRYLNELPIDGLDDNIYRKKQGKSEYDATNPLGLTVVRQVGPDGLIVKWRPVTDENIYAYELFVNGLFIQRVRSPGRAKTLLHPLNLQNKIILTLNLVSAEGETEQSATVVYP